MEGDAPPAPPLEDGEEEEEQGKAGGLASAGAADESERDGAGAGERGGVRDAVREKEGGKAGVSAPRDDAAAMEEQVLVEALAEAGAARGMSGEARGLDTVEAADGSTLRALDGPTAGVAVEATVGAAPGEDADVTVDDAVTAVVDVSVGATVSADLSAVGESAIVAQDESAMAQTVGADFLGSALFAALPTGGGGGGALDGSPEQGISPRVAAVEGVAPSAPPTAGEQLGGDGDGDERGLGGLGDMTIADWGGKDGAGTVALAAGGTLSATAMSLAETRLAAAAVPAAAPTPGAAQTVSQEESSDMAVAGGTLETTLDATTSDGPLSHERAQDTSGAGGGGAAQLDGADSSVGGVDLVHGAVVAGRAADTTEAGSILSATTEGAPGGRGASVSSPAGTMLDAQLEGSEESVGADAIVAVPSAAGVVGDGGVSPAAAARGGAEGAGQEENGGEEEEEEEKESATRAQTAATDASAVTEGSANLDGPDEEVVVRSLVVAEEGVGDEEVGSNRKGRFRYVGHLNPFGKQTHRTLRAMAMQMNLPDRPRRATPEEQKEHGDPHYLEPRAAARVISQIAEDERGRHRLCISLQAMARGVACRAWLVDQVAIWMQQKEMAKMEAAIAFARTNGAATTLQRVSRGHTGRVRARDQRRWRAEEAKAAMEARWAFLSGNFQVQASLLTRVAKGHVARNLARAVAADLEKERQLAFLDLKAQRDVVGAFEFDAAEDDADDELEEVEEKGDDTLEDEEELDFGDDATPRAVTQWYEKVVYPERQFPWTDESLGTDVNAAAARRIQTAFRGRLARLVLGLRQQRRRRAQQAERQRAARNIQMAFRQFRVVQGEERRRVHSTLGEVRQRSATKIQALVRGSVLRMHVARRREVEQALQRQRIAVAAVTMQSLARGYLERRRGVERRRRQAALKVVFSSAQRIQARWRGVLGRNKMREVRSQRAKYAGELVKQEQAARALRVLVLQAVYRGHLGRELYRERLVEIEAHRRLAQVKMRRAALMFQGLWRGYTYRNRRRLQARLVRLGRAASRLQRVYRGHLVRNDVGNQRFQLLYGHMATSVTVVASNYRMHMARRRRRDMLQYMFQTGNARFLQVVRRCGSCGDPPAAWLCARGRAARARRRSCCALTRTGAAPHAHAANDACCGAPRVSARARLEFSRAPAPQLTRIRLAPCRACTGGIWGGSNTGPWCMRRTGASARFACSRPTGATWRGCSMPTCGSRRTRTTPRSTSSACSAGTLRGRPSATSSTPRRWRRRTRWPKTSSGCTGDTWRGWRRGASRTSCRPSTTWPG